MALTTRYVSSAGAGTYAGSTSSATPMSLTTAFASATAADLILIIGDGTYTRGANDTFALSGTITSPIIFRGVAADGVTSGFLGRSIPSAPLTSTNMPLLSYGVNRLIASSANFIQWENLQITSSANSNTLAIGTNSEVKACKITNSGTGASAAALSISGTNSVIIDNDIMLTGASGGMAALVGASTSARIRGNRMTCTSSAPVVLLNATGASFLYKNVIFGGAGIGISVSAVGAALTAINNTITALGGDGIDIVTGATALHCIEDNMITDCGGYGIDLNSAGVGACLANNRFRDNTSGNVNLGTDWVLANNTGNITVDTGGPTTDYTTPATPTFDFSLIAASPGTSAGSPAYSSMGAFQRSQTSSGTAETSRTYVL